VYSTLMTDLCRSSLDRGVKITAHSDVCVSPVGPLRLVERTLWNIFICLNLFPLG